MFKKFKIGDIIEEGPNLDIPFRDDACKILLDKGYIKNFSIGQYIYTKEITAIFRSFRRIFRNQAHKLNYEEWIFPRLLPQEVLEKFGSVEHAPRTLFEATQFYENPLRKRNYHLDSVQSAALFYTLAKEPLDDDKLPLRVIEMIGGGQYRNEKISELHGMERLIEYLKIEHVYVGYPEQVIECRNKQIRAYKELFDELKMRYRIVVGAPCHSTPENTRRYEKARKLDEVPLFDFEFYIPYSNEWMEVCGVCVEADENTKSYGIASRSAKELWSGCSGIGLNRLVFAFLSQHGFEQTNYPDIIQK